MSLMHNLRPLPMRITQKQYDRLQAARINDQITIQEHVRRALDNYLDGLDRKAKYANPPPTDADNVAGNAGASPDEKQKMPMDKPVPAGALPGSVSKRKNLVYR